MSPLQAANPRAHKAYLQSEEPNREMTTQVADPGGIRIV
jgi:hypothetical protein